MKPISLATLRAVPKAELHLHLDGTLRVSTMLDLARRDNVSLPTTNEAELTRLVRVGADCTSLVDYLRAYDYTLAVMQTRAALERTVFEAYELCAEDGVTYCEGRFSPVLHTRAGLSLDEVMEAVGAGRARAQRELGMQARLIVCAMRHHAPEQAEELARLAVRYKAAGVVGFDIAGPEKGFSATLFEAAYRIAAAGGLGLTAHAGEADDHTSVVSAIDALRVTRVGHGTNAEGGGAALVARMARERIAFEVCLTSNVLTKTVMSLASHPVKRYLDAGCAVTLNTDGVTQTNTTLSQEYLLAHQHCNLSVDDLITVVRNGFAHSFLPPAEREALAVAAAQRAAVLLKQ